MIYESTQLMDTKIKSMYNTLYALLEESINIDRSLTFVELIQKVENLSGHQYYFSNNIKPINNIVFDINDTLLRKEIKIYYKIEFLTKYLKYALRLNGVPQTLTDEANTLNECIQLVNFIKQLKDSTLTLDIQDDTYYFNSYCVIPYSLTSDSENIDIGNIIVLEDNIEIARIKVGKELKFLPSDVGTHKYTFYYEGSSSYKPTDPQTYDFRILPAKILIDADVTNISESQYKNNKHIGYDEDTFELKITTLNPYIDFPASNIPFFVNIPQKNNTKTITGITNENGIATINFKSSKIDTFDIFVQTTTDGEKVSNNNTTYSITIYCNPIKIDDYKFYEQQTDKEMEIFFYENNGELTNNFLNSDYSIVINENYRNFNLANKNNPFIIQEEHTDLGAYEYEYILKYKNSNVAITYNTVRINKEIRIKIVPENKFLTETTKQIKVHIYTTNYRDQPLSIPVQFISSYLGVQGGERTTNADGYYYATINIGDILTKCNGFLLQAFSSDDNDVISNAIYYRIDNDEALESYLEINTIDGYNLNNTSIPVKVYLTDSEGEDIIRPIQISDGTNTFEVEYQPSKQCYEKEIILSDSQIGEDITITVNFNGENNHYLPTQDNRIIEFIKSNVNNNFVYSDANVYEQLDITASLNIENNSNFNKYIGNDIKITTNNNEYLMNKSNDNFTLSITPLNAGQIEFIEQYLGNKWTNPFTNRRIINIAKTSKYLFDVTLSNDTLLYGEYIIFHPSFEKQTSVDQEFTGTISYNFSNGDSNIYSIEDYRYRVTSCGEQEVTITYSGDSNHEFKSITKQFIVNKITPAIECSIQTPQPTYRSDIDYKKVLINYTNNDYNLNIKIYDNDTLIYNTDEAAQAISLPITTTGQHTIKLQTDETNIYNSYVLEKEIELYDFVDELYKIVQDMLDEEDYDDNYLIAQKSEQVVDCLLNNDDEYDEDILEGLYKILEHLED